MFRSALVVSLLLITSSTFASDCDQFFPFGKEVSVADTRSLCSSFFVTVYSEKNKSALFSSAILEAKEEHFKRKDTFRPDERLSETARAELSDYHNSGYDRGHLTPNDDAKNGKEAFDTFLLSNMTPQSGPLNRGKWKELEEEVRANQDLPLIVVTGAVYGKAPKTIGKNQIPVPSGYYKLVYHKHSLDVFYADNKDGATVQKCTLRTINHLSGINFPESD